MVNIILTRDPGLVNVLLRTATNSSVTLLGDDEHQTTVPIYPAMLAVSPLIIAMLVDTGLHPSVIGQVVLSLPGTDSAALSHTADILSKGKANVKDMSRDIIDEVKVFQFQMLGVAATLSISGIMDEILNDNGETLPSSDPSSSPPPPPLSSRTYLSHEDEVNVKMEPIDIKFETDEGEAKKVVKEPVVKVKKLIRKKVERLSGGQGVKDHVKNIAQEEATTKQVKQKAAKNVNDETDSTQSSHRLPKSTILRVEISKISQISPEKKSEFCSEKEVSGNSELNPVLGVLQRKPRRSGRVVTKSCSKSLHVGSSCETSLVEVNQASRGPCPPSWSPP